MLVLLLDHLGSDLWNNGWLLQAIPEALALSSMRLGLSLQQEDGSALLLYIY